MSEVSLVLGTAGHIDHGKTALINALTGINCDRLIEEKRRGITIELGFAPLTLNDDRIVSVIDVPGHEKFIRQMVAGASGIDAALLVVAADESVMPQTREHLAIMELLGVHDGLIALTKIDRVKDEAGMLELVADDVREFTRGTFLEGKAIVPVSSVTGEGLDTLREEITRLIDRVKVRPRSGAFFLPVDRAFTISGFGTVITGTAYHGTAKTGDRVEVLPSGREGRIRTLQVHSKSVDEAYAGQRVAANLAGIDIDEITRGDVVCMKGVFRPTKCVEVVIRLLPDAREGLKHWQRVHVCTGTSEVLARVSLLDAKQADAGQEIFAQLVLEESIVCTFGQRFILRFYSPLITIGGGEIIYPYSYKPRGAAMRAKVLTRITNLNQAKTPQSRFEYLLTESGRLEKSEVPILVQDTQENITAIISRLINQGKITELDNAYISSKYCEELLSNLTDSVREYQNAYPSEPGIPIENLKYSRALVKIALERHYIMREIDGVVESKSESSVSELFCTDCTGVHYIMREIDGVVESKSESSVSELFCTDCTGVHYIMREIDGVVESKSQSARVVLRTPDFVPQNDEAFAKNKQAVKNVCMSRKWQLMTLDELQAESGIAPKIFAKVIQAMRNAGELAVIPEGFVLISELEAEMRSLLRSLGSQVTLAQVRDATGSTRKYILPILEYFDSKGFTRRAGDYRAVL